MPSRDDRQIFEMLTLEGAQAGLSGETILKKRVGYRKAFARFDPRKVATFGPADIARLMADSGIVRNRLKVESTINNAAAFLQVQREFGRFADYLSAFLPGGKPIQNAFRTLKHLPAETELSRAISKDMKKRGFRFVGPTVIYAFMQAVGMTNDHVVDCFRHKACGGGG